MFCRRACYRHIQQGEISSQELKSKIQEGAILLDVRSNQEYREGHLGGAINIPEYEIEKKIEQEIPKKNQLIIAYCQYGARSRKVYFKLKQMGYTNIYNLHGGLDML